MKPPSKELKEIYIDFYNQLKEPYKTQAIDNFDSDFAKAFSLPNTLQGAIAGGFYWLKSPQGQVYWHNVSANIDNYMNTEKKFTKVVYPDYNMWEIKNDEGVTIASFNTEADADLFLQAKAEQQPEPKKVTVKELCKDLPELVGEPLQCTAFRKLLHCAEWANGNKTIRPKKGSECFFPFWNGEDFDRGSNTNYITVPFYLTHEAYDCLMEIEGIERELHIFLNTGVECT